METKRDFLKKLSLITVGGMMAGTVAPAVASAAEKKSAAAKKSIGLQIYSLGKELFDDVPGGMKKIAQIGYDHIELAGYREGKMGTYTLPEYRKIVEGEGLKITS